MKKVAVLLADGFEEVEGLTVVDVIRRAGISCDMVSISEEEVKGAHNIFIKADKIISDEIKEYDLIVLPGGLPGATNLQGDKRVIELVQYFNENNKLIGAICAAPIVLGTAGVLNGKNATSYPGFNDEMKGCMYKEDLVVKDGNIITSRGPSTALLFAYNLLEALNIDSSDLQKGMLFDILMANK